VDLTLKWQIFNFYFDKLLFYAVLLSAITKRSLKADMAIIE